MYRYFLIHQIFAMVIAVAAVASMATARAQGTGEVVGTVTDSLGAPIAGATVRVEGSEIGARSRIDGKYRLRRVPAGRQILVFAAVGYRMHTEAVDVIAADTTLLNVELQPRAPGTLRVGPPRTPPDKPGTVRRSDVELATRGSSIVGTVRDDHGNVMPGATVRLTGTTFGARSRIDGSFAITGLPAGDYQVTVSSVGYLPFHASISLPPQSTATLNADMQPGKSGPIETPEFGRRRPAYLNPVRRGEAGKVQRIRFEQ